MVIDEINKAIKSSIKNENHILVRNRAFLRLIKGEIESMQMRQAKPLTEDQHINVLKKLLKANEETITHLPIGDSRISVLQEENLILGDFIPETLSGEKLKEILTQKQDEILAAKSSGQAVGVCMKFLKEQGVIVDGNQVKLLVESIRSQN